MKSLFSKYILLILFSTLFVCVSYSQWSNGQDATMVLGQADFVSTKKGTTDRNFSGPTHVVVDSKHQKLYVFEEINNRILRFSIPNGGFNSNQPVAEAVFGQVDMVSNKLGITSASTFLSPLGGDIDEDRDILWVADGTANRVLAFYNASFKQNGASADIVLGQKDFVSNQIYAGAGFNPSAEGMNHPSGVAVDKE